jgi:hypothetical protein
MIDFLIKSTLSLTILLAVYHLALEKEKMHQFNRFYLLFCIVFSFSIPFITIEIIQVSLKPILGQTTIKPGEAASTIVEESTGFWFITLWSLYSIVTLALITRFGRNIWKLTSRIKSNTAVDYKNSKLVLVKEKILPHTFLNTIFINETDYHNRKIEAELYTHELIHVTQKHTLDILFIETLKVLFWFNPVFIFYKKAIQLNHEFLADEKVVKSYNNVPFYQNLLLSVANVNSNYYLASNLNYSITKKRLIMMTKTTSASKATLKKLVLVPLFSGILFLSCSKTVEKEETAETAITGMEKHFENTTFLIKDEKGNTIADKKFNELTSEEKENIPHPPPPAPPAPKNNQEMNKQLDDQKTAEGPKYVEINTHKTSENKALTGQNSNETKPTFPGGMAKFYQFVAENYKIPTQPDLNGKVYLTFIVEKDGSLSEIKILRDIGYGTGEEAVRVLKLSPKWIPGTVDNKPVRVEYSLPITIQTAK